MGGLRIPIEYLCPLMSQRPHEEIIIIVLLDCKSLHVLKNVTNRWRQDEKKASGTVMTQRLLLRDHCHTLFNGLIRENTRSRVFTLLCHIQDLQIIIHDDTRYHVSESHTVS